MPGSPTKVQYCHAEPHAKLPICDYVSAWFPAMDLYPAFTQRSWDWLQIQHNPDQGNSKVLKEDV